MVYSVCSPWMVQFRINYHVCSYISDINIFQFKKWRKFRMIKKLIIGVIILSGLFFIPFKVQADDLQIIKGVEYTLSDTTGIEFEFNYVDNELFIVPVDAT